MLCGRRCGEVGTGVGHRGVIDSTSSQSSKRKSVRRKGAGKAMRSPAAHQILQSPLPPGIVGEVAPLSEEFVEAIAKAITKVKSSPRQKSDEKEELFKAARNANPEATRAEQHLELLRDRASRPELWETIVGSEHLRSWCFLMRESAVTWEDFEELWSGIDWRDLHSDASVMRRTMWFTRGDCMCPYNYGQQRMEATPIPSWFDAMMRRWLHSFHLNESGEHRYPDCVNLNLYEHGRHSVSWHSDDEPLFRGKHQDTRIISVSLGSPRKFQIGLRAPRRGGLLFPERDSIQSFQLGHGDICTMEGLFQKHYIHQVVKSKSKCERPRINATFRWVVDHAACCPLASAPPCVEATNRVMGAECRS